MSAGISATNVAIQKKIYISETTAWIISNEQYEDITTIVQSLEELELLIKAISETIKKGAKEQKVEFLLLLGKLVSSTLRSALTGRAVIRVGDKTIRAGENF